MFRAKDKLFPLGEKTLIMGILNYTPDSFSDGNSFFSPETALERALLMEKQGADIIDIGAVSTRPGAEIADEKAELSRLHEVLPAIKGRLSVPFSVDTFRPECAAYALEQGASIINDVSGVFNYDMVSLVKEYKAAYIVTHNPCGADSAARYPEGVITAVKAFFDDCLRLADKYGLPRENLCLDPGFGFGKSRDDDYEIVRNMRALKIKGVALLAGASRKRMTNISGSDSPAERDAATAAIHTLCTAGGADIIRVHNVETAAKAAAAADRICRKVNNG